jgi:phage baseplate assembly protein W
MKRAVHKTILHTLQTAIENIEARCTLAVVHLNAFLWTPTARRTMEGRE